jgi:Predicted membrane protein
MLLSAIVMISLDFVYLSVMKGYFANQVKNVQGSALKLNYFGAAICYIFLVAGLNYFIIKPRKSVSDAFLLGLVIYGVYETTNYALFSNWSIVSVIIDTLWGGLLFASTAYIVEKMRYIFKKIYIL